MNARSAEGRGPVRVPLLKSLVLSLFGIPVVLIVGVLSLPFGAAALVLVPLSVAYFRHRERRFAKEMRSAGRFMEWELFTAAMAEKRGTLIKEWFSEKGPVRCWWTEDTIPTISPNRWTDFGFEAVYGREYDDFSCWCHERYLDPGRVLLVSCSYVPELEHDELRLGADGLTALPIPVVAVYSGRWSAWAKRHAR
jgi:hypothetical protein